MATLDAQMASLLEAMSIMEKNVDREQKQQANEYLEQFQKSIEAWNTTHLILQSEQPISIKLFAATTMKGKITYDLHQIPREQLPALKDSLFKLLVAYRAGPNSRLIRTQLCVCLASLALQMTEWKSVLADVGSHFMSEEVNYICALEFLKVLPEEVNNGRKVSLSDEELDARTKELLPDSADVVVDLFTRFSHASIPNSAFKNALIQCITSWIPEIDLPRIVVSPIIDLIFAGLEDDESFEASVDCLCQMFHETRDVDESHAVIQTLYSKLILLRAKVGQTAPSGEDADSEQFRGYTRLFSEAGEAWIILVARFPIEFRGVVETLLECLAKDEEQEVLGLTFEFWYELKNYVLLEAHMPARMQFMDIFSALVDHTIKHLQYPDDTDAHGKLFDGDKEREEKFREFRHSIGDVLKDCCDVVGATDCLEKAYALVAKWTQTYGQLTPDGIVPRWQELEAPLFSMRAMGRMIPKDENVVLPKIMEVLKYLPEHPKIRYATTLVLGRYTFWTSVHPEYLQYQLSYITSGFDLKDDEVQQAAAMALRFFCQDCGKLLVAHAGQLQLFYEKTYPALTQHALRDVTDAVAYVVAAQPLDQVYDALKLYVTPLVQRLIEKAQTATERPQMIAVADNLSLLVSFVEVVNPYVEEGRPNPMITFFGEILPVVAGIIEKFLHVSPVCEKGSQFFRKLILSYRLGATPLLPEIANILVAAFQSSYEGCFLWVTGVILREFSDAEHVPAETLNAVFEFFRRQALTMFAHMGSSPPNDYPDLVEDFFRLMDDAVQYHPLSLIEGDLLAPSIEASNQCLRVVNKTEPLTAVLHYLLDLINTVSDSPPTTMQINIGPQHQKAVRDQIMSQGPDLITYILSGMLSSYPRDCVADSSSLLLALIHVAPQEALQWVTNTLKLLPPGSVTSQEHQKFLIGLNMYVALSFDMFHGPNFPGGLNSYPGMLTNSWNASSIKGGDRKKVRVLLQDFCNLYRRRNVTPRGDPRGLGSRQTSFVN